MTEVKQVLMLCYHYPPAVNGGVWRSLSFATTIGRSGWEPIVVTTDRFGRQYQPEGEKVVRTGELRFSPRLGRPSGGWANWTGAGVGVAGSVQMPGRRIGQDRRHQRRGAEIPQAGGPVAGGILHSLVDRWIMVPDARIRWTTCALPVARSLAGSPSVRVLYSTSPPASSHLLALKLKKETGKPWIMDMRDPWTIEPLNRMLEKRGVRFLRERRQEAKCIGNADLVIANTPEAAQRYREIYPDFHSKIVSITNGFDRAAIDRAASASRPGILGPEGDGNIVISHTGNFSRFSGETLLPEEILVALSRLHETGVIERGSFRVVFAGNVDGSAEERIRKAGLEGIVGLAGTVSHFDSLRIIAHSDALILYDRSPSARYYIRGKLYEYLGTGKWIIGIMPPGAGRDLLERSGHGIAVSPEDTNALTEAIADAVTSRRTASTGGRLDLSSYERSRLAVRLAEYLDGLAGGGPPSARNEG